MSVSAILFVTTKNSNIHLVMPKVMKALNVFIRAELDKEVIKQGNYSRTQLTLKDDNWTNGCSLRSYDFESFNIDFGVGEKRTLFATNGRSCDHSKIYEGEKIIFLINVWGRYDEIMKVIAEPLKEFGRVFYDFNDCDDQDFVEL